MTNNLPQVGQRVTVYPACYLPGMAQPPKPIGGEIRVVWERGAVNVRDDDGRMHLGLMYWPAGVKVDQPHGNYCTPET